MKLITHNILHSTHKKGVKKGYPLIIEPKKYNIVVQNFNKEFIKRIIHRLNWEVLRGAIKILKKYFIFNQNFYFF